MTETYVHTVAVMGTVVTIQVVGQGTDQRARQTRTAAVERAIGWFSAINDSCTRFDPASELHQLSTGIGVPSPVSALLFEAVQFALAVADETDRAFDPAVGMPMETLGFNQEFRSGQTVRTPLERDPAASYRDVHLDPANRTVTLGRPLLLDLGAVAKGLAIDMAARELEPFKHFSIDAGGDLYLGGCNPDGKPWSVGIRHPRADHELIETVEVSGGAVCTSGDYERRGAGEGHRHHVIDPRTGASTTALASVTVIGPSAMLADALSWRRSYSVSRGTGAFCNVTASKGCW